MASDGILLLQFCLLCFIGVAWWAARRDLNARAASAQAPTLQNIREVEQSIADLLSVLEAKAETIESHLVSKEADLRELIERAEQLKAELDTRVRYSSVYTQDLANDPTSNFDTLDELIAKNIDAKTIARQSGLAVAEVETLIRMRQLRQNPDMSDDHDNN